MGKKSSPPPPPDFTPLVNAAREMSAQQYALQREQFAWAKEAYAENMAVTRPVVEQMLRAQRFNQENAEEDRQRWEAQFRPIEDRFAQEAMTYDTAERRDQEMGRAMSLVAQQAAAARNASLQRLEGFGIDPSATRYAALDRGISLQQAAAQAAAGNQTSMAVDNTARALRAQAIQLGRQSLGQGMGMQALANQSGGAGVNASLATTASGANTMGTAPQYGALASNALGMAGNMLGTQGNLALNTWKAEQEADSGLGSLLGAGLGFATKFLEDGGAVETAGGAIPMGASPSAGQAVDDVPARLTAGEFVVPKDVAAWKGEEFFQKLIEQSRKAKQTAPAKPETALMPAEQPAVASRPQGGALPLR